MTRSAFYKTRALEPWDANARKRHWLAWRRERAMAEYEWFIDRRLGCYSVDGYKDDPHRTMTIHEYGQNQARKHCPEKLASKKSDLRDRWGLADYHDIRLTGRVTHHRSTRKRVAERRGRLDAV